MHSCASWVGSRKWESGDPRLASTGHDLAAGECGRDAAGCARPAPSRADTAALHGQGSPKSGPGYRIRRSVGSQCSVLMSSRCAATDHAKQRRPAHCHTQRGSQPGSGPPCQRQPDCCQRTVQADAAAGVALGQPWYLLDESACRAVDVVAEEPSHRQAQHDRSPRNGEVSHPPLIAAVHPGRYPRAPAATRPPRPSVRCDDDRVVGAVDAVDHHRRQMRQQNPATVSRSHRPRAPRESPSGQPGPASRNVCQNHLPRPTTDRKKGRDSGTCSLFSLPARPADGRPADVDLQD